MHVKTLSLAALVLSPTALLSGVDPEFHWGFVGEVASGYLSSGGTLGDTRPITTQCALWREDFGEYGSISGYFWTKSSFHNRQHDSHRATFDQLETAVYYGRNWRISDGGELCARSWGPCGIRYSDTKTATTATGASTSCRASRTNTSSRT